MDETPPAFAVVVVAADADNLRELLPRLQAQSLRERLEVVVVVREGTAVDFAAVEAAGFRRTAHVTCDARASLPAGLALGTRAATAPFVALIEDHCYPDPAWAEALHARHLEGHTVVGSEIANANPGSALSWCSFLLTHGAWSRPARAGVVEAVAGDNSSYRRDAILAIGGELEILLASGTPLHWKLRESGHSVFLEPRARAAHLTPSRLHSYLGSRFHNGRAFAGLWSRPWPLHRRLYFALLAPVIALRRVLWAASLARLQRLPVGTLELSWLLFLAALASTLGYAAGFLIGAGTSVDYSSDLYFRRHDHLQPGDRAHALEAPRAP